jgi:hypothetical protein
MAASLNAARPQANQDLFMKRLVKNWPVCSQGLKDGSLSTY